MTIKDVEIEHMNRIALTFIFGRKASLSFLMSILENWLKGR